ncbi:hypothetical protein [Microterricola viridarii]|nr:hypothetical protein [Microterricola viridarii]
MRSHAIEGRENDTPMNEIRKGHLDDVSRAALAVVDDAFDG